MNIFQLLTLEHLKPFLSLGNFSTNEPCKEEKPISHCASQSVRSPEAANKAVPAAAGQLCPHGPDSGIPFAWVQQLPHVSCFWPSPNLVYHLSSDTVSHQILTQQICALYKYGRVIFCCLLQRTDWCGEMVCEDPDEWGKIERVTLRKVKNVSGTLYSFLLSTFTSKFLARPAVLSSKTSSKYTLFSILINMTSVQVTSLVYF